MGKPLATGSRQCLALWGLPQARLAMLSCRGMRRALLLVADRNPRFLEKTQEILVQSGHEMIGVSDGNDARVRLSRDLDGVLCHSSLPGLSGFALCRLAKEKDPSLPVVLMFSAEDHHGELEAKRAGADNWLVRPLKRLELLYVVRDLVSMRGHYLRSRRVMEERDQARKDAQSAGAPETSRLVQFEMFKRLLGIELKRAQRYGFPLSLLLASLDDPPRDGNRDALAQAARSAIRDIDIPVAFAGSDVLVVMPHTDLEGARLVAERIRKRLKAGGQARTSIGVVTAEGGQRLTFATLLAQATRAQKSASRAGGDRVVVG
jgi:PleD family two-component response regulator